MAIGCITVAVATRNATAFGVMNLAFAIAGVAAPVITGSVFTLRGSFTDAYWLISALAFLSVTVVLVFHTPDHCQPSVTEAGDGAEATTGGP